MAKDTPTALDLPMVDPLPDATQKYFDVCQEKLGMVPNVLRAYAFDIDKLNAFTANVQRPDAGRQRAEQAGARDDRGSRVVGQQVLLLPDGPRGRRAPAFGQPDTGRDDGDELARGRSGRAADWQCWALPRN